MNSNEGQRICERRLENKVSERRRSMTEKKKEKGSPAGSCESCMNYEYDEEYECYTCEVDLDEDEIILFLQDNFKGCPYYRRGDEYAIVRKQM